MIIRGTTPTLSLHIDSNITTFSDFVLSLRGATSLDLKTDRIDIEPVFQEDDDGQPIIVGTIVSATLTQEETLGLHTGPVKIQLRAKSGNMVVATPTLKENIEEVLLEEAI